MPGLNLGGSVYDPTDPVGRLLLALLKDGEYSTAELADVFGVARSTIYRAVERERLRTIVGVGSTVGWPVPACRSITGDPAQHGR